MNTLKFLKYNIISLTLFFFSFFIILLTIWIKKIFGSHIHYVEIVYNIFTNYDGIKNSPTKYKIDFFLYTIYPSIFLSIAIITIGNKIQDLLNFKYSKNNKLKIKFKNFIKYTYLKKFIFNSKVFLFYSCLFFLAQFRFIEYFDNYAKFEDYTHLYENPYFLKYDEPKNKKNLIIFYIESFEYNVSKLSKDLKDNPIEKVNKIIPGQNIYDFKQNSSVNISVAGLMSSQCSIPFFPIVSLNMPDIEKEKIFCLSDVLDRYNYEQYYFMSVDKIFQSSGKIKEKHQYKVVDNLDIRKKFPNASNGWGNGVFDDILLNYAKDKIIELHNSKKLFNVVIKNTDSHVPFYTSNNCKVNLSNKNMTIENKEKIKALKAYSCATQFITSFFKDLEKKGVLDNTVVVLMGDHLAHGEVIGSSIDQDTRNIYFRMNTNKKFKRSKMNHFDLAPTILDEMGYLSSKDSKFGFGVSLFQENLNYDNHYNSVMDKTILSDFYLRQLFKIAPHAHTL